MTTSGIDTPDPSLFTHYLKRFYHLSDTINKSMGQGVAWLSIVMAVLIFLLVVTRALVNFGSIAAQELVTYFHAFLFLLAMAYTLRADGHIRVDIFYRRFSKTRQAWINIVGSLFLLLPFAVFLVLISWNSAMTSWQILESSSNTGGIPATFILKSLIPLAGFMLFLQGLAEIARNLIVVTYIDSPESTSPDAL